MRKKKMILSFMLSGILLMTGCSDSIQTFIPQNNAETVEQDPTNLQTSTLGIDSTKSNFLELLENNTYYVVQDNMYYPINFYLQNQIATDKLDIENAVVTNRMLFYTTENEQNIPTLYEGSKLVYYSTDTLLDYITWERYYDMKYTIGVSNLLSNVSGRQYIDMENTEDTYTVLPDSSLYELYQEPVSQILFDKIGGVQITKEMVDHGVIIGTEKDTEYDVEVYTGTYFKHFNVKSNYHAFHAYELFASIEYNTLQDYLYEIEIPDYLVNGYYSVNEKGLLRIVRGTEYNDKTDFNEQLLYEPIEEDLFEDFEEDTTIWTPNCYSAYKPLNHFETNIEGKLGYKTENEMFSELDNEDNKTSNQLKESVIKDFKLWVPKDKDCIIKIKSNSGEKTGSLKFIYDNGKEIEGKYDYLKQEYILNLNGSNEIGTLQVSGFFTGYEIELTNIEVYNNQDSIQAE